MWVCGGGLPIPSKIFYSKKYASVVVFLYITIPRSTHVSLKLLELIQLITFKRQSNLAALIFFSDEPLDIMELMPVNNKKTNTRETTLNDNIICMTSLLTLSVIMFLKFIDYSITLQVAKYILVSLYGNKVAKTGHVPHQPKFW